MKSASECCCLSSQYISFKAAEIYRERNQAPKGLLRGQVSHEKKLPDTFHEILVV